MRYLLPLVLLLAIGCGDCADDIGDTDFDENGTTDTADAGTTSDAASLADTGRYRTIPSDPNDEDGVRDPGEPGVIDVDDFATACSNSEQCVLVKIDLCKEAISCTTDNAVVSDKFGDEIEEVRDRVYEEECADVLDDQVVLTVECFDYPICLDQSCTNHKPYESYSSVYYSYPAVDRTFVTPETAISVDDFDNTCTTGPDCAIVRRHDCVTCPDTGAFAPAEHWAAISADVADDYREQMAGEVCENYTSLPSCSDRADLQAVCVQGTCDVRVNE